MTPTEVVTAWSAGADFVKVFPCAPIGGDKYIKALHASLPQIPLIAAGGVNQQTAANFILVGGDSNRHRHGIDSDRGHRKTAIGTHPRIGTSLHEDW